MVVTNDEQLYRRAFAFHDQGHSPSRTGVEIGRRPLIGLDFRMTEIQGAIMLAQLRKLSQILERLRKNKKRFKELIADLRKQGVYYSTKWEDQPAPAGKRVLRLLAPKGLPAAPERLVEDAEVPSLETMTRSAISTLSGGEKGFFLMVEGGQIDWALHALETGPRVLDEIHDLDEAVRVAVAFAEDGENWTRASRNPSQGADSPGEAGL